jgi:hypothetical protein
MTGDLDDREDETGKGSKTRGVRSTVSGSGRDACLTLASAWSGYFVDAAGGEFLVLGFYEA